MQLTIFDALLDERNASSSGKMSPECSAQRTTHSVRSWVDWSEVNPPSFLMDGGATRVWSLDRDALQRGGSWMPNISEWLSEGGGSSCSLTDILEAGLVPTRFFLSRTACQGILRRAAKRGKALPPSLAEALRAAALEPISTAMEG